MIRILLFPFAVLYDVVTRLRNVLYDRRIKPSVAFEIPVISVGNLTVGGTGKTPMIEYLIRLLSPQYTLGVLSRGYGRSTKGYIRLSEKDTAETAGDEPLQFFRKFGEKVTVSVGEERALAIPMMLQENEAIEAILLDDAFQHRKVRPSLNVLLSDYTRPFYRDLLLPAGRLRESSSGAARADVVVVTKCPPELSEDQKLSIEKRIRKLSGKPVFFTTISYGLPVPFSGTVQPVSEEVVLVSGIANHEPLLEYVRKHYRLVAHLRYADHHQYTERDVEEIAGKVASGTSVLTTEKDMVKLDVPRFMSHLQRKPFFYLPITVQFLKNEEDFDALIINHVNGRLDKNSDEKTF
jgi:tetraacyldisaccharide 4'-kinase